MSKDEQYIIVTKTPGTENIYVWSPKNRWTYVESDMGFQRYILYSDSLYAYRYPSYKHARQAVLRMRRKSQNTTMTLNAYPMSYAEAIRRTKQSQPLR